MFSAGVRAQISVCGPPTRHPFVVNFLRFLVYYLKENIECAEFRVGKSGIIRKIVLVLALIMPVVGSNIRDRSGRSRNHGDHAIEAPSAMINPMLKTRADYLLSPAEPRSLYRGALCGWLWHSRVWVSIALAHVLTVAVSSASIVPTLCRAFFAFSTVYQTWASDALHNLDLTPASLGLQTLETEFLYWRLDVFSISLILSSQYAVWSSVLEFWGPPVDDLNPSIYQFLLVVWGPLAILATLLYQSQPPDENSSAFLAQGENREITNSSRMATWRNVIFGLQFFSLLYLAVYCNLYTTCGYNGIIWLMYAPGFVCFLTKDWSVSEQEQKVGPHEWFHVFVYAGHLTTIVLDVGAHCGVFPGCWRGRGK